MERGGCEVERGAWQAVKAGGPATARQSSGDAGDANAPEVATMAMTMMAACQEIAAAPLPVAAVAVAAMAVAHPG